MSKSKSAFSILSSIVVVIFALFPFAVFASTGGSMTPENLTDHSYGYWAVGIFIVAYTLVIFEDLIHMRKSKPVIVAAGIIWVLVALAYQSVGKPEGFLDILNHNILEYAMLLLFLLAAMTFINTMEERNVFAALRSWLVSKGYSLKAIFWITGILAFFISPLADNLTTALLMAAVVVSVVGGEAVIKGNAETTKFVVMACINIVVAANAGGAFSPFGDITTLMVWQAQKVEFIEFFSLFVPSVVNWFVPALIMSFFIPKGQPAAMDSKIEIKRGGLVVVGLFMLTIAMAVTFHSKLHLPPMLGMMTGLGLLKLFGYYLKMTGEQHDTDSAGVHAVGRWDIFNQLQRAEWDTLMFFYGVILCVGGLGALGYLALVSEAVFEGLGVGWAGIIVGVLSAIVDNIPVMFAVLSMNPEMNVQEWLLITLTAGVGGSLLSVGSAAGVALMGQARGIYTFFAHLKWTWAIALGYVASIWVHFMMTGISL